MIDKVVMGKDRLSIAIRTNGLINHLDMDRDRLVAPETITLDLPVTFKNPGVGMKVIIQGSKRATRHPERYCLLYRAPFVKLKKSACF